MLYESGFSQHCNPQRKHLSCRPYLGKDPRLDADPKATQGSSTGPAGAGTLAQRFEFLPLPPGLSAEGTGANATSCPTVLHGRIPAGRWSATLWVKVTPAVAAGSPARPDARNHVASAGPRQRASPPSAFLRSEAPGPPHPSPVCLHLKGAACSCCRPSCLRFVPKGPSRPWGWAPRGPRLVSLGA